MRGFFFVCLLWCCVSVQASEVKQVPLHELIINHVVEGMGGDLAPAYENKLVDLLLELKKEGYVWRKGDDAELRPLFVTAQGLLEEAVATLLKEKKVSSVCGAIHTPMVATPLCMDREVSERLVAPVIASDQRRLVTVTFRAKVLRNFLDSGGHLYVAYPAGGFSQRTLEQQLIYRGLLKRYPELLIDVPLTRSLPPLLIGATYRVQRAPGEEVMFAIGALQSNVPDDDAVWRLWLGCPRHHRQCSLRLQAIECLIGRSLGRP